MTSLVMGLNRLATLQRVMAPARLLPSTRTITSKEFRRPNADKPAPWPYKERGFKWWHQYVDRTMKRIDENSRIVVVEGNIGSGKAQVARELAERLDFHLIPAVSLDDIFVNSNGVDRRKYYHLLPDSCRHFDARLFYENPNHPNVAGFQGMMFYCKVEAYLNALAHMMNTGQGVVIERVAHSDFVFVNAMHQKGLLSTEFVQYYRELRKLVLGDLSLFPHLVVYLDCPVNKCMENIKKRNIPWETNGKVIDFAYLELLENGYKQYLNEADDESVIMVYDWSKPGETSLIVEDIEKVDLDTYDWHKNNKFEGWYNIPSDVWWGYYRYKYTNKADVMRFFDKVPYIDVPELLIHPDDQAQYQWVVENVINGPFSVGYDPTKDGSFWNILLSLNIVQPLNANWYDYYLRDGIYQFRNNVYAAQVDLPNIPEEELKPRDFVMRDGKVLKSA